MLFILLGLFALAVTVFTASGLTVSSVAWEPVFAGAIFLVIGTNTMMLGVCSKLFAPHLADQEEDWTVRLYRRHLGLERLLAVAAGLVIIGLGMDAFILVEWLSDSSRDLLALAAVAQSLIVIGVNLAFGALVAAMIDYDYQS
jgi:predicted permease